MIKIKNETKLILSISLILCILITITVIYPEYNAIWDVAFLISIFYTTTQAIFDTSKSRRNLPFAVIIAIAIGIIVALYEIAIGNHLIFSTATLILANFIDSILNKKK